MLHSVRMGDPGNEGVDSVSSQVAEAVLGSKGPWPPGLVDYFQSYQISLGKCSCRSGAWPGCGPLSPPPPTPPLASAQSQQFPRLLLTTALGGNQGKSHHSSPLQAS